MGCPFCPEEGNEPQHWKHCEGRQGHRQAIEPAPPVELPPVNPLHNVRRTDPDTSVRAALLDPTGRMTIRKRVSQLLEAWWPEGYTDYHLADLTGLQQNSVGKRRGELRDMGFVRDSGETAPGPSGSPCIKWVWVKEGEAPCSSAQRSGTKPAAGGSQAVERQTSSPGLRVVARRQRDGTTGRS
jgi:hypothetical protein